MPVGTEDMGGSRDDWDSMTDPSSGQGVKLRVIDLDDTGKEYKFVQARFNETMTQKDYTAIVNIHRVQNPALYAQYAAKKQQMDTHIPSRVQSECWLFHGTTSSAVPWINQTNFNRSYRGQNGMWHVINHSQVVCIIHSS